MPPSDVPIPRLRFHLIRGGFPEAVAAVHHPNVVQVYETGEAAGRPYMALEFLAGETLAERLRQDSRLDPRAAAALVADIAAGVAAAHKQGS